MNRVALLSTPLSLVAVLSAWPSVASSWNDSSSITPRAVARMIDDHGGERAVDMLIAQRPATENEFLGGFDLVLDGISSGDPAWLALVPRLDTRGHAAAGESLPISVAYALPKNAAGVLRLLSRDRTWLVACGYPMIEPTREEELAYFKAAIPAVEAVGDSTLQAVKRMCLSELLKAQRTR